MVLPERDFRRRPTTMTLANNAFPAMVFFAVLVLLLWGDSMNVKGGDEAKRTDAPEGSAADFSADVEAIVPEGPLEEPKLPISIQSEDNTTAFGEDHKDHDSKATVASKEDSGKEVRHATHRGHSHWLWAWLMFRPYGLYGGHHMAATTSGSAATGLAGRAASGAATGATAAGRTATTSHHATHSASAAGRSGGLGSASHSGAYSSGFQRFQSSGGFHARGAGRMGGFGGGMRMGGMRIRG
ncbi:hypothetical protein CYMTET_48367 [Cymbomonas tetramitiformis]|uniref:Uncharacterized protein n=1 Tax=Cymbomonas tetramitiformis TaxID=36881 RepID=A0AAE0BU19_9CHLO|nr:hypothetical protein CYMTET_48367 [Cymbomonas tetramitiformis]